MKRLIFLWASLCILVNGGVVWGQPFGLSNRVGNTTLRFPPAPPVYGYTSNNFFPGLSFSAPVGIVTPPGETNRLFIVEQSGRISVITNLASPTKTMFLNFSNRVNFSGEQGLLGLAFHPGYLTNRYIFVFYVTPTPRQNRLSRLEISATNENLALPNTEVILISQPDDYSNHNAGDLHFGADGYLYVSLGDEGDSNDNGANSQRIDKDFFSGILRLDVDKLPGSLAPTPHAAGSTNYAVPPDNPFVGATTFNGLPLAGNVRTEFWAVGLRNPWRFSFDRVTGTLYCGDVGQGAREEIDVIERGGNYGWFYREGKIQRPGSGTPPAGFVGIDPIHDYPRSPAGATNVGFSVTGGIVYRGNNLPELNGAYIFGDYGSGNIWALRHSGTNVTSWFQVLDDPGVAAFGVNPSNGDVLYADVAEGSIKRITKTFLSGTPFAETLADAGAFSNLVTLTPHAGIVPYEVNLPMWADNAIISRWSYFPSNRTITYRPTNNWAYPTGSVWIQHFELELTNGVAESRRRIETRFLVRDSGAGAYGVTYRWDSQTNATLVPDGGMEESFTVHDAGTVRTQTWRYPSQTDCLRCHTSASQGGLALGFNTPQLNRDFNYGGIIDNQIRAMSNAGYFAANSPATNLHALRALPGLADESHSVESRVRGYLSVNCSHCHQPSGSGIGNFDTRIFRTLSTMGLINGLLVTNGGNPNNRVIKPESLAESMLLTRVSTLGAGRMPPLGHSMLDTQAISLISRWITNDLASYQTFAQWQTNHFGSTNAPQALANADPDEDRAHNFLEYLSDTDPNVAGDGWGINVERTTNSADIVFQRIPNRGIEIQWSSNLTSTSFWRFLNVPENRPYFSSSNVTTRIPEAISNAPVKFYRGRVYEQ